MQAIQINQYGDNSVLKSVNIPIPKPKHNQVLVKLKSSSVNPIDYKIRSGFLASQMSKEFPFTLGWEGAGIITEIGKDAIRFKIGDEVMVMPNFMQGGTYAEYVVVNENETVLKPSNISFSEASILPFSLGTAYTSLIEDAKIKNGQRILIHGAGGAVGQMALQIAKMNGLFVVGTASGQNIQELIDLGIDQVIDYKKNDFTKEVKDFNVIVDLVGGETLNNSYPLIKKGGTIITTTQPPLESELIKYGISGKMTFTTYEEHKFKAINEWIEGGKIKIKPPLVFKISNASEALANVESRKAKSKIVFEF